MNPFVRKLLALAGAAAILLSIIPTVHTAEAEVSTSWDTLDASAMQTLVPTRVREISTDASLTRRNLCGMTMNVYKSLTGLTDAELGEPQVSFIDSFDQDVLNAYVLDLVTADDSGFFYPSQTVSRQDFFTSAAKLLELLGYPCSNEVDVEPGVCSDAQVLLHIGAIEDTDPLEPNQQITIGEAVLILDRVVSFFTDWQTNSVKSRCDLGKSIADLALTKVGCSYVCGGQGPKKFDCSGLVYWVYKQHGYDLKPGARNQWSMLGDTIKKADLRPGDLLFYSKNGRSSGIFHVGIYIGDGQFVHAANSRKDVIVTDMDEAWYANRYLGAKRAIN